MFSYSVSDSLFSVQHCDYLTGVRVNLSLRISSLLNRNLSTNSVSSYIQKGPVFQPYIAGPVETSVHHEYHSNNPNHRQSHPFSHYLKMPKPPFGAAHINRWGARWLSGRVSDSGARGPGFETYRRRVVSLSKTLYSPKVLVNYPGSDGSVPT